MSRLIRKFDSVCEHCDEGKTKAETITGIIACTTCGTEDQDFVPFISECDFLRTVYKAHSGALGAIEEPMEYFVDREDAKPAKPADPAKPAKPRINRRLAKILKEDGRKPEEREDWNEEKEIRRRDDEESEKILNDAFLSDEEKRLGLFEIRQRRKKRKLAEIELREKEARKAERWEREIRKEEKLRHPSDPSVSSDNEEESDSEDNDPSKSEEDTQSDSDSDED